MNTKETKKTKTNDKRREAVAIERSFFSLINQLNDQTLKNSIPELVKMLRRYDRLLEFRPSADFTSAIDVRLFYATFGRLKEADTKARREIINGTHDCFSKGQLQAIDRARMRLVKGGAQELKPIAILPVFR